MKKRFLLALASTVVAASWLASTAAACHSEISATIDCQGNVTFTAEAWNGSDATTASRTNPEVKVWASTNGGSTWTHIATGSFSSSNGFKFTGTYAAGSASTVKLKIQETRNWGNGDSPAGARYLTLTKSSTCGSTPTCPAQNSQVMSPSQIVVTGDRAKVTFGIAAGCKDVELTLVSYKAPGPTFDERTADQQTVHDYKTQLFSAGSNYQLEVAVPNCYYQIDFVYGKHIVKLGPAGSSNFYGKQGRLIRAGNGGTAACAQAQPTTPTTTPAAPQQPVAQAPVVVVQQQPVPAPGVELVKTQRAGTTGSFVRGIVRTTVGKRIFYRLTATNTSAAPVTITVVDRGCDAGTLAPVGGQLVAPGASVVFTCSHRVTKGDGARIVNVATATATASNGAQATDTSRVEARVRAGAVLGAQKTVAKKAAKAKPKPVKKKAKPAKPVVAGASFTG